MAFQNLLVPNNNDLFCGDISVNGSIDSGNSSSSQIYGTIITTTTSVATALEYPLADGNYILQVYANALTTAGPQVNGGISQIGSSWLNVQGGLLSITTTAVTTENRYGYGLGVLTYTVGINPSIQNRVRINVQNSFAGNTTKWTVVAQIYGLSTTNF